jgi:hypothetical protein
VSRTAPRSGPITIAQAERDVSRHLEHFQRTIRGLFYGTSQSLQIPCAHCGVGLKQADATVDHITPKSRGGALHIENVAIACWDCNQRRGSRDFWRFRESMRPTREQRARRAAIRRAHGAEQYDAFHAHCHRLAAHAQQAAAIERRRLEREIAQLRVALFVAVRGISGRDPIPQAIAVLAKVMPEAVSPAFVATPEEIDAEAREIAVAERGDAA